MLRQLNRPRIDSWRHAFHGMPVRSSSFVHPLDGSLLCVDSAVSISDAGGCEQLFFGHAAGSGREQAVARSCGEILERLLASRAVFSDAELASGWRGRYIFRDGETAPYRPAQVLVRENAADGDVASASGLGLGPVSAPDAAIAHACLELVERHILVSMWYAGTPLTALGGAEQFDGGYRLDGYTTLDGVPFVLAVLSAPGRRGMYCGSAVRASVAEALAHARAEALQLATNFLVRDMAHEPTSGPWQGNVAATIVRMASLEGESARALHAHLAKRIVPAPARPCRKLADWRAIVRAALPDSEDISAIRLGSWGDFRAVRVIADGARTKNAMRRLHAHSGHIADPFC